MRNRIPAILLASGTALALGLTAAPSFATTMTWTVSPGGAIAGSAGTTKLTDTKTGSAVTCSGSGFRGALKSGSGLPGAHIGTITSLSFTNCSLSPRQLPWSINFTSLSSGVVHGTISGVSFMITSLGCSATVGGSTAGSTGTVPFNWTLGTSKLKLLSTGTNLHFNSVSGCLGLYSDGDPATYTATYTVTPPQHIF